jgi:hypothetical protein
MSAYRDELCERLTRDGAQSTAKWFIEMVATGRILPRDFSELEWKFWDDIVDGYEKWRTKRLN